ncbi:MAG: hypothetical protein Q9217_001268 [Psora testacea]
MPQRQLRQEESWNSLHRSEASCDVSNDDFAYSEDASLSDDESDHGTEYSGTASPMTYPTVSHVHKAIHPLQATADRVGKQVEEFAENLDRYTQAKSQEQQKVSKDCRCVLSLVEAYQKTARETIQHLQTMHAPERQKQFANLTKQKLRSRSSRSHSRRDSTPGSDGEDHNLTTVADLQRWELEEQTWDLLGRMLQVEYPVPEPERSRINSKEGITRPDKAHSLHAYSPEKEVWDSFLATNDQAWERHTVIEWLKRSADHSGEDIEHIVQQLESEADRGSGLQAHSWLYTREAIKGQKRLRSWPRAFEPDDPGLDTSLMNAEKTKALVTQLDPDVITRQCRILEKQDVYFERAIWLACWEMVRRGKSWKYIRDWCDDRAEQWRAVAVQGDMRIAHLETSEAMTLQSRFLWRKTCALAAKDGSIDEYEKAVYGVLSGYFPSVQQISRSWDDHLFAHYNTFLLHSYESYVKHNFANRIPFALASKDSAFNISSSAGQRALSGNQVVEKLKQTDGIKQEAREPFKMLQGSLIAKNFDEFTFKQGVKLTQYANAHGRSKILPRMDGKPVEGSITAPITMQDYDMLRLITHIILIYQDLGFQFGKGDRLFATESIIVAYVDYLSKAGKQQLLPLYASRLSHGRSIVCLGRQLPLIQEHNERVTIMNLMKQYSIDVPGVLLMQMQMIILDTPPNSEHSTKYPELKILEPVGKTDVQARPIRGGFIGDKVTDDQMDLIRAFEWYMVLEGYWQQTMAIGVVIYKHFLRSQGLAAARKLSQEVTLSRISLSKSYAILRRTVDISKDHDLSIEEDGSPSSAKKSKSRGKSHQRQSSATTNSARDDEREILLEQSRTFRDLESLLVTLNAMEEWRYLADQVQRHPKDKSVSAPFKKAFLEVVSAMDPLLHGWLQNPKTGMRSRKRFSPMLTVNTDAEADEFEQIGLACLPEVILAYNSILNFSSYYAGREILKQSMDMAALFAEEGSELAACIVAANRMPELMDSFAVAAKSMILAEARKPGEKGKDGKPLGLWSVRVSGIVNAKKQ